MVELPDWLIKLAYLLAASLFVLGLKGLTRPRTAVRGNLLGALGMLLAIVVTLLDQQIVDFKWIVAGLVLGTAAGVVLALKIQMTAMPQLVALFNGFGGGASALVAGAKLVESLVQVQAETDAVGPTIDNLVATVASGLIGAVTLTGSLVAFAKLQELISGRSIHFTGQQAVNAALGLLVLALGYWVVADPSTTTAYWLLVAASSALGVLLVLPIGGADMPVVIALLNSYSGLAAAATGFVLHNNVLIVAGALVGASGLILTRIMCDAMNRSLTNVLFGIMSPGEATADADEIYAGKVKSTSADEVAMLFDTARRVIIVPGYGLAVARAQHAVRDLAKLLEGRGVEVLFAIHPVAGRMPGHMNVLLAEADVPYDKLKDLDAANPLFEQTDMALVIGANDVVNPLARTDPTSPIAGMPILDVGKAQTVVVIKRSMSPGFAGIPNPLFAGDHTLMFFGDGQKAVLELIAAVEEL